MLQSLYARSVTEQTFSRLLELYQSTAEQLPGLQPGEFLETVRIPLPRDGDIVRSYKISKRFDQDISAVCAAVRLRLDGDRVEDIRIAYGGMAATILRAPHAEAELSGKDWNEAAVRSAQAALVNDFKPLDDMRATASYRMKVAQNLLLRMLLDTSGQLDQTVYDYGRTG